MCLIAHDYFELKIKCSKVLEELPGFPTPRSTDFLCQFKVILSNELALVQTIRTLTGSLTLPCLLVAASEAKCLSAYYTLGSQMRIAFIWEKKNLSINIATLSKRITGCKRTSPTLAGIITAFVKCVFHVQNV